jgi:hypothetical protein
MFLVPGTCALVTLPSSFFARPPTSPPISEMNFGLEVVPSIAKGILPLPLPKPATFETSPTIPPCKSANILNARLYGLGSEIILVQIRALTTTIRPSLVWVCIPASNPGTNLVKVPCAPLFASPQIAALLLERR